MYDQNCLIWIFFGWNSKKLLYCGILYQYPQIFRNTKFHLKIKIYKFATKIYVIGYFGLDFRKTNAEFKINILEFVNLQSFIPKQKNFKLGTKIVISA